MFRQIVLNDEDPEVRKLALKKLARSTDQSVFKQIVLNDKDPEVRELALSRITDQQFVLDEKDPVNKK